MVSVRHTVSAPVGAGLSQTTATRDSFTKMRECPGLGVWVCKTCDGCGKVENPIAMIDHDDSDDLDPWPFGDLIDLAGSEG